MNKKVYGYRRAVGCFVFAVLVIFGATAFTSAQTQITTGTIQGSVRDRQGAAVPGATVEIKNLETNAMRTLTTDDEGLFAALALQPGAYSVTVTKSGFAKSVAQRVELTVGQALKLPVAMKVSG